MVRQFSFKQVILESYELFLQKSMQTWPMKSTFSATLNDSYIGFGFLGFFCLYTTSYSLIRLWGSLQDSLGYNLYSVVFPCYFKELDINL